MSDKALMNRATLELTQKLQMHFPTDIPPDVLQAWNGSPKEVIQARLAEVFGRMPVAQELLQFLGTVTIPATTEPFIAQDEFVEDTSSDAKVKIVFLDSDFKEWFLGKTEEPIQETVLCYHKLTEPSVYGPIIAELGGESKSETTLAQIFALMKIQRNGEAGALLSTGYANIFYVRGANNLLRAVVVCWVGGGWRVDADSVEDPDGWSDGSRVFSSNS
ncbi:MAG: hypothetical protein AAB476_01995 [Patescibacteria group bacterium]